MKTYTPQPADISGIELSPELLELTESMAVNVHEVWSAGRIAEGWQYGAKRDDVLKLHPCLVPYGELPASEKEYDRATAISTLKLIRKLGFEITKK
jgi:ryanodine receptor 2